MYSKMIARSLFVTLETILILRFPMPWFYCAELAQVKDLSIFSTMAQAGFLLATTWTVIIPHHDILVSIFQV